MAAVRYFAKLLSYSVILSLVFINLSNKTYAAQLTNRSVQLSSASPSASASYTVNFTYFSASNVGSVVLEFCANSPLSTDPCTSPTGLSASSANLSSQSGNIGFSIDGTNTTANKVVLTRPSSSISPVASSYTLSNMVNPSTANYTVYIRVTTFASTNASGTPIDFGAAAASTANQLSIGAFIPPFLTFCVGVSVAVDCSSGSGDSLDLGIFKTSATSAGTSQFSVATNDVSGYDISIHGTTLTSGNNTIPALSTPSPSSIATNQFGINLRHNTFPSIGADPDGNGIGDPTVDYNQPNLFVFRDADSIANSTFSSYFRRMTVSYIANVNSSQPPGVYNATFTYIATVQF